VVRCKQWEDFQELASGAQTVSFVFRESDRTFEADAVKDNRVIAYIGTLPELRLLLKAWITRQMRVSDEKIFEGALTIA